MNLNLDSVTISMLKELCKKYRMKEKDLIQEYISDDYNNNFKKKR